MGNVLGLIKKKIYDVSSQATCKYSYQICQIYFSYFQSFKVDADFLRIKLILRTREN